MTTKSEKIKNSPKVTVEMTGSEAMIRSMVAEGVETIFGYPGGAIMPIYDALYDFGHHVKHVLVRHEQGAVHAAQGYARVSGKVGVCFATSGPGATNLITGIADAMIDSTPIVCITGQVTSGLLGTDAFQESDVIGISMPITKWNYQITSAEEIPEAVAKAFYIASTGRPGPVLLDITKDAQFGKLQFAYEKCTKMRSYVPEFPTDKKLLKKAADLINEAKKPYLIYGQGILLSGAEKELKNFIEKTGMPAASTLLGISALESDHPLNMGMLGMHGNYAPNIKTNECDLLIAIGMRFDDRVTGNINTYAKQAKVIHIEIDPAEIDKNIKTEVAILGDAKHTLRLLTTLLDEKKHTEWVNEFLEARQKEHDKVIVNDLTPTKPGMTMGEVIRLSTNLTGNKAVIVTDVGQNQMAAARYARFSDSRTWVTSGGLGTMGFGLPAAIGAKFGTPEKEVILFAGDGGIQVTVQELGTISQEKLPVKIVVLNNDFLGMVRQWQELFFEKRYSFTEITSPDFVKLAAAYGIPGAIVTDRKDLESAMRTMIDCKGPYLLEVRIEQEDNVFPMVPAGGSVSKCLLGADEL